MSTVPGVAGLSVDDATALLAQQGFSIGQVFSEYSDDIPSGAAVGTNPSEGWSHQDGGTVDLLVSGGPNPVTGYVPDVAGVSYDYAAGALTLASYQPANIGQASPSVEEGLVIGTRPVAGTWWEPGRPVDALVSTGWHADPGGEQPPGPATPIFEPGF